jgi:hypothetical protein
VSGGAPCHGKANRGEETESAVARRGDGAAGVAWRARRGAAGGAAGGEGERSGEGAAHLVAPGDGGSGRRRLWDDGDRNRPVPSACVCVSVASRGEENGLKAFGTGCC